MQILFPLIRSYAVKAAAKHVKKIKKGKKKKKKKTLSHLRALNRKSCDVKSKLDKIGRGVVCIIHCEKSALHL